MNVTTTNQGLPDVVLTLAPKEAVVLRALLGGTSPTQDSANFNEQRTEVVVKKLIAAVEGISNEFVESCMSEMFQLLSTETDRWA